MADLRSSGVENGLFAVSGVEHCRFTVFGCRTMLIFGFLVSNKADLRLSGVGHGRFTVFGSRTWPIYGARVSNMAALRFSGVEYGRFTFFGRRVWSIYVFRAPSMTNLEHDRSDTELRKSLSEINCRKIFFCQKDSCRKWYSRRRNTAHDP